jgi:hypothetical protein
MNIAAWLERRIEQSSPTKRRRLAVHTLIWSVALGIINVALYVASIITVDHLILITLALSWLAITITAADLVATTDVRETTDETN